MYQSTDIHNSGSKWINSLRKLKSQHYSKRVSPLVEKNEGVKPSIIQTAVSKIEKQQNAVEEVIIPATPELSVNCDSTHISSGTSSLSRTSIKEEQEKAPIDGDVRAKDHGIAEDTLFENEEVDDRSLVDEDGEDSENDMGDDEFSDSEELPTLDDFNFSQMVTDRPLPPLPMEESGLKRSTTAARIASKGQKQLKRATTWLGLAGQKLKQATPQVQQLGQKITKKCQSSTSFNNLLRLASSQNNHPVIEDESDHSYCSFEEDEELMENEELEEDETYHSYCLRIKTDNLEKSVDRRNMKTLVAPKRIMHCQVKNIFNLASSRDCEYELQVQLNNEVLMIKRGVLRKADKTKSLDILMGEELIFELDEPFELNFIFAARYTNMFIKDNLAKLGLWPIQTKTNLSKESTLPMVGHRVFTFEDRESLKEISSFKLIKPDSHLFNIELTVDFKVEEILPTLVEQFPWAFTTNVLSAVPFDDYESLTADPYELPLSQDFCRGGDYLTIYTRGLAHPVWRRFWVTLENEQLNLFDFTYKGNKEPLYTIPLVPLLNMAKPSFDDYENVGISRKTGFMLYFNKSHAILTEPVRIVEEEGLEGKVILYADSEQSAIHWRRTLGAYLLSEERAAESDERIDLRFLW